MLSEAIRLTREALAKEIYDPLVEINARNNLAYFYCALADKSKAKQTERAGYISRALEYSEGLPSYSRLFRRMHGYWLDTRAYALYLRAEDIVEGTAEDDAEILIDSIRDSVRLFRQALELGRSESDIEERAQKARQLKKKSAEWLRRKAEEEFDKAQNTLTPDSVCAIRELLSAADEFDPLLNSGREENNFQRVKALSLLIELGRLLDSTPAGNARDELTRRIAEVTKGHEECNEGTVDKAGGP